MSKRTFSILTFLVIFLPLGCVILWSDFSFSQVNSNGNEDTQDMLQEQVLVQKESHSVLRNQSLLEIATGT
jgi:hypothetical protein